ncbi:hypothetical protein QQ045_022238 [Rhodiola kirilowii]
MDLPSLAVILQAALSTNPEERKAAEQTLNQIKYVPQHIVRLLQIVVDGSCDLAVRQVASIQFKNFIAKNWSPLDPADALYYNAALTLSILHKLNIATNIFTLWFQMLQEVKRSGARVHFKREQDKKVCCLGLTSLLALPSDLLPGEALGRVFKAALDLLVAYKAQVAENKKLEEEAEEEDDNMDGFQRLSIISSNFPKVQETESSI